MLLVHRIRFILVLSIPFPQKNPPVGGLHVVYPFMPQETRHP